MDCDRDIIITAICSVGDFQNSQSEPHSDWKYEELLQDVVSTPVQDDMDCTEMLTTYFVCHNTHEKTFKGVHSLHKSLITSQCQSSRHQPKKFFFCKNM